MLRTHLFWTQLSSDPAEVIMIVILKYSFRPGNYLALVFKMVISRRNWFWEKKTTSNSPTWTCLLCSRADLDLAQIDVCKVTLIWKSEILQFINWKSLKMVYVLADSVFVTTVAWHVAGAATSARPRAVVSHHMWNDGIKSKCHMCWIWAGGLPEIFVKPAIVCVCVCVSASEGNEFHLSLEGKPKKGRRNTTIQRMSCVTCQFESSWRFSIFIMYYYPCYFVHQGEL